MTPLPGAAAPFARLGLEGDVSRIVELYADAVSELSVMRGGRALIGLNGRGGEVGSSFRRQLGAPDELVVVGLLGGGAEGAAAGPGPAPGSEVVGYGTCGLLELSDGERVGSVRDLYVDPLARRQGVGRAMSERIVSWCAEQRCVGVDANALPGSRAVKSFFEAGRFTARLLVMHRPLPPAN